MGARLNKFYSILTVEISLEFRKHPVVMDIFLLGNKNFFFIFFVITCKPTISLEFPPPPCQRKIKNSSNTFPFPKLQLFAEAIHMD
jgi:hypothetical protein